MPALFVMLLNVIGCGQVVYAADQSFLYSDYFDHDISELNDFFGFDFTDLDAICAADNRYVNPDHPYYFYSISCKKSDYDNYVNGSRSVENLYKFDFYSFTEDDLQLIEENDYYFRFRSRNYFYRYLTAKSSFASYPFGSCSSWGGWTFYYKNTGSINTLAESSSSASKEDYCDERIYFYQSTNIPDFPFPDFVNHGSSSDSLKVDVHFKPTLSGKVDRLIKDANGDTALSNRMRFTLTNNSRFPIQYSMFIVKIKQVSNYPCKTGHFPAFLLD